VADDLTQTWDLVRKAQGGSDDALDRLFQRYYERVRRAVRVRIGAGLRARLDTEDILQPAFARAFQNFERFEMRHEGSLLHWLAEYAEGQIRDAADREKAKKRRPPGVVRLDDSRETIEIRSTGPEPAAAAADREQQDAVEHCVDQLAPQFRTVVMLRDYDGLPWSEIAALLGKPSESAARDLHKRALRELNRLLKRNGIGPAGA
jgi:RNA polymerase sigma-70 factor (ECF subfamily)